MDFSLISIILRLPGVIVGFSMHEFAHALAAHKLGDPTPEMDGKLTISPRAHIDPLGIILLAIMGFGWANPVRTNPRNFKNPVRDQILVSLAGPVMNLIVAFVFVCLAKVVVLFIPEAIVGDNSIPGITFKMFLYSAYMNLVLLFFNLIPLAPLDGFNAFFPLLPVKYQYKLNFLSTHGSMILMGLILASYIDIPVISSILGFLVTIPCQLILGIFLSAFGLGG